MIRTRFAPSPTGKLHIGGARTALFNYLFSKYNKGEFLLRIENTDKQRSSLENINVILNGLEWLNLTPSKKVTYQSEQVSKHLDVAYQLIKKGFAYKCYLTFGELEEIRTKSRKKGIVIKSPYRDNIDDLNKDFVIRLKMPIQGTTTINDTVQGHVKVKNSILDDMVLVRRDNTPTYMLASVVDDYNMRISHIIRGDDHFNNAFRQIQIIKYMNWPVPNYTHIPLIHGEDGTKLSKRHGAENVLDYNIDGYEPLVLSNYLLRLGYSINDDNIYDFINNPFEFRLDKINKSPSRFDIKKLSNMNSFFLRNQSSEQMISRINIKYSLDLETKNRLIFLFPDLIKRYDFFNQIYDDINWLSNNFIPNFSEISHDNLILVFEVRNILESCNWNLNLIKVKIEQYLNENKIKMKDLGPTLRLVLTGKKNSPDIFKVIYILGKEECIKRLTNDR